MEFAHMKPKSVAIIAYDSLDAELVKRWAAEGYLPTFKRLFSTSRHGLVFNPTGLEAGSAWPTFTTGVMPDYHGEFDAPYLFDTTTYDFRLAKRAERVIAPFWVTASNADKRVCVIDVPYVLLEDSINGIQVADWLVHVRRGLKGLATQPHDLAQRINGQYGLNPFPGANRCPTNDVSLSTAEDIIKLRDKLLGRVRVKSELSCDLLAHDQFDLFITVFHDPHDIGHMCWHIHDENHEWHDHDIAAAVGDPILDIYKALDASLESLLEAVGEDADVIVYSSHGIGAERRGTFLLDDILVRLEEAYKGSRPATWMDHIGPIYRALIPSQLRRRIGKTKAIQQAYKQDQLARLKQRRFFELSPNHATGGVRFNLQDREQFGLVSPGREFEDLCTRLEADLKEIINVDSGEPLAETVTRTSDIYSGPLASTFPDLLIEWNKSNPIERVYSPTIGLLENRHPSVRSGDHTQKKGMFLALGPRIEPGARDGDVQAIDFAPTIAALLGYRDARCSGNLIPGVIVDGGLSESQAK